QESLQKALRGLEVGSAGFESKVDYTTEEGAAKVRRELSTAGAERIWYLGDAFRMGLSVDDAFNLSKIDPWFLVQVKELIDIEQSLLGKSLSDLDAEKLFKLKRKGFSDKRLALLLGTAEKTVRHYRQGLNIRPVYKRVDTCAAEFATSTRSEEHT